MDPGPCSRAACHSCRTIPSTLHNHNHVARHHTAHSCTPELPKHAINPCASNCPCASPFVSRSNPYHQTPKVPNSRPRPRFTRPTTTSQCLQNTTRTFVSSAPRHKKAKTPARTDTGPPPTKNGQLTPTDDVLDLSGVEQQILKAIEKLTHDLSQLRSGGRLNPEVVEGLKVQLGTSGKDGQGKETLKLGDIAQVVPRGRMLQVICGEAEVRRDSIAPPSNIRSGRANNTSSTSNPYPPP